MRRAASLLLVLFFGLSPLSGLLQSSDEVRLPACCRRHGAHHCAAAMQTAAMVALDASNKSPILTAPLTCPMFPGYMAGPSAPSHALAAAVANIPALQTHLHSPASASAIALTGLFRTHAARGPPASFLL